jgi:NAD(P)-dependent dehydrogenase (short-subunit alcohol dehydrogenase family)
VTTDVQAATFPDLSGASVFITGGGSGIGAALTEGFLRQGARVAFVQRSDGTAFADAMAQATGNRPLFLRCDVSDTAALRAAIAQAAAAHGPVSRLICNAANDQRMGTLDVTDAFFDQAIGVNLKHYLFAAQAVIPAMQAARHGSIVLYSSISYMMPTAGYPVYLAANAAITGLARTLAQEFGADGIRVNALAPGWVLTDKQRRMWATPEGVAAHLSRQALKRELLPPDMVGPTLFLASDTSAAITGQCLVVDGGVAVTG